MRRELYRYGLDSADDYDECTRMLSDSLDSVEALHGVVAARLDARHSCDDANWRIVIDASTPVGKDLVRIFTGDLCKHLGETGFRVERIAVDSQSEGQMA